MRRIRLTNGKYTIVSDVDYQRLSKYSWGESQKGYVRRQSKKRCVWMHREVFGKKVAVDHINGKKRDNRRGNLRECNQMQNLANSKPRKGTSKYKGVRRRGERWLAQITPIGQTIYLGSYSSEKDAARAYNRVAKKLWGRFARLNNV